MYFSTFIHRVIQLNITNSDLQLPYIGTGFIMYISYCDPTKTNLREINLEAVEAIVEVSIIIANKPSYLNWKVRKRVLLSGHQKCQTKHLVSQVFEYVIREKCRDLQPTNIGNF